MSFYCSVTGPIICIWDCIRTKGEKWVLTRKTCLRPATVLLLTYQGDTSIENLCCFFILFLPQYYFMLSPSVLRESGYSWEFSAKADNFCNFLFPILHTESFLEVGKTISPVVYSTDHSKALVPVLVLLFIALWFILRGNWFQVLPCVIWFLRVSVLLALRLPCLGK